MSLFSSGAAEVMIPRLACPLIKERRRRARLAREEEEDDDDDHGNGNDGGGSGDGRLDLGILVGAGLQDGNCSFFLPSALGFWQAVLGSGLVQWGSLAL